MENGFEKEEVYIMEAFIDTHRPHRKGWNHMKIEREQGILFSINIYYNDVSSWLSVLQNVMYGTLVSGRIIVCFPQMN